MRRVDYLIEACPESGANDATQGQCVEDSKSKLLRIRQWFKFVRQHSWLVRISRVLRLGHAIRGDSKGEQ